MKIQEGRRREWGADVNTEPGGAFAGYGFTLALRALRERLMRGEGVELQAVGFTPRPRLVTVYLSYARDEDIMFQERAVRTSHFVVHPNLPWIAGLFVRVPDAHIWLGADEPFNFVRWDGFLAEPSDPTIRVDGLGRMAGGTIPGECGGI